MSCTRGCVPVAVMLATGIADALRQAGLDVPPTAAAQLADYLLLLERWNRTYNLTAVRHGADMIHRHIVDSLVILPWVRGPRVLDVGSGAGLPGIPLAIGRPALHVVLLDSSAKRVRFMRQAVAELNLGNVEVAHGRVEDYRPEALFDSVVARAFAALAELVRKAGRLCRGEGRLLAMKGTYPAAELAELPATYRVEGVYQLQVPGLDAERHLVHCAPNDSPRDNSWLTS